MIISPQELSSALSDYLASANLPGLAYQELMLPEARKNHDFGHIRPAKESAVLMLLYPEKEGWQMVLTKRHEYNGSHSAQVCLPGGKYEKYDKSLVHTAIRETQEEVGFNCEKDCIVGKLTPVYIHVSNYNMTPYIGILDHKPTLKIDPQEVNYTIDFPLQHIVAPQYRGEKELTIKNMTFSTPIFKIPNDFIWGATAMVLSEFAEVLKRCHLSDKI